MFKNTLMVFAVFAVLVGLVFSADGQTRKKRKATQPVTSVPTTTEPQIVSRAADVSDNEPITEPTPVPEITPASASANVADL